MRIRRQTVEHPFGTIKSWMGSAHFLTKTLERVSTEMSLHVLAYNLKRVMKILGNRADGSDEGLMQGSLPVRRGFINDMRFEITSVRRYAWGHPSVQFLDVFTQSGPSAARGGYI